VAALPLAPIPTAQHFHKRVIIQAEGFERFQCPAAAGPHHAPQPCLPRLTLSAPPARAAMEPIFELLDALPRHFSAVHRTDAAAKEANSVAIRLGQLVHAGPAGHLALADASKLER